ncbi:hypothetical protein BJX65DRAFT_165402 [Aspergillus insuetus]
MIDCSCQGAPEPPRSKRFGRSSPRISSLRSVPLSDGMEREVLETSHILHVALATLPDGSNPF